MNEKDYIRKNLIGIWAKVCIQCGKPFKYLHKNHPLCRKCYLKSPVFKAWRKKYIKKWTAQRTPEERAAYNDYQRRYNEIKRGRAKKRLEKLEEAKK